MYTSFYNLEKKPFQISSDPSFLWFGEKHKEALATLKYGILDNKGFLLLTGDVGTGKTTLINALVQSLSDDVICTSVPDPGLEKMDFFNYIAAAFGIDQEFSTKGTFLAHFREFLLQANKNKKKVLLIIDESQLLTQELLEEIRLLSNIEKTDAKLINIFFVGQNEFNEILNREQNRAVRQRLTLNYNIDPLTPDETAEYINYRLGVAGATQMIFDDSATQEVFMYSGGFPRRINVICDHSLLSGYVNEHKIINDNIVSECAKELKIPAHVPNRNINGFAGYNEKKPSPSQSPQPSQPFQPPVDPPPQKREKYPKKNRLRMVGSVILFLVFACLAWGIIFPQDFRFSVNALSNGFGSAKQSMINLIPEPYLSFLTQKAGDSENHTNKNQEIAVPDSLNYEIEQKDKTNKGDQNAVENDFDKKKVIKKISTDSGSKIYPIQDDFIKKTIVTPENHSKGSTVVAMDIETGIEQEKNITNNQANGASLQQIGAQPSDVDVKPQKKLPLPEEKVIIRFKYNTNDFTEEGFKKLVLYSDILAMYPETKIVVTGYTDSNGNQKYNRKLSEFRANIVRSFLLGRGIGKNQVDIRGLGSENPIEANDNAWGRTMNRRVEIEIKQ